MTDNLSIDWGLKAGKPDKRSYIKWINDECFVTDRLLYNSEMMYKKDPGPA